MEVLTQFGTLPAVAAVLYALAALIWSLDRLTRDVLTFRLVRRALKKKKKARKTLSDLAKVIEAQQGKRKRRRWRRRKNEPPSSKSSS